MLQPKPTKLPKILVTGYLGFIGRNMMAWLAGQGYTVEGWDWHSHRDQWPQVDGYAWVIHLGAVADMNEPNVEKCLVQNYDFSRWLFEQCNRKGVNLQYASSSSVYGQTRDFSEFAQCQPGTPYAWSKYLFDRWVFEQEHRVFVQGFRYFNVYGEFMHLRGHRANVIHRWREQARQQGKITVYDQAHRLRRDWTWVGDVCRLHSDFLSTVMGSGIWNVGTGVSHSFLDIAQAIAQQSQAVIDTEPMTDEAAFRNTTCADLTHLRDTVGPRSWLNVYDWLDQTADK